MSALIDGNEAYQSVTVIKVDWDLYRDDQFTKDLGVRRQSTLVMFKDGAEIDRVIGQTGEDVIGQLFEKAIAS